MMAARGHGFPVSADPAKAELTAGEIFQSPLSRPAPFAAHQLRQIAEGAPLPDLHELDSTEAAIAREFSRAVRGEYAYDWRCHAWRFFDAPIWRFDQVGQALLRLQEHQEQRALNAISAGRTKADRDAVRTAVRSLETRKLKGLLDLVAVQEGTRLGGDEFDRDPLLFAVKNGVIDLRSGTLRDGRPSDYLSLQSPIAQSESAECPRFLQFLDEIFEGDAELIGFVRRWAGYSLTGLTTEQVFLCWWGAGSNGKSVLASTLEAILGTYAITLPFATFTKASADGASATPDLARLPGRRLAKASEVRLTSRFDESRLKSLTGEDVISARPLYGQPFEFQPVAKLLFLFNDRPRVTDLSHAFWRRALLVPFRRQFTEAERDGQLKDKLLAEAAGILRWMVKGCLEWQRLGLCPPAAVRSAVDEWRAESDLIAEFIGTACEPVPGVWVHTRDMYTAFQGWCQAERIDDRERVGRRAFTVRLGALAEVRRRGNGNGFVGLKPMFQVAQVML
jgi:putative DNA primase/helicase